ncbi:hypothetical protein RCL1_001005 [Eukaryota sp. TZLM3-RCL]
MFGPQSVPQRKLKDLSLAAPSHRPDSPPHSPPAPISVSSYLTQIDILNEKLTRALEENASLTISHNSLRSKLEQQTESLQVYEEHIASLRNDLEDAVSSAQGFQVACSSKDIKIREKDSTINLLKEEISTLRQENKSLEEELESIKNDCFTLQQTYSNKESSFQQTLERARLKDSERLEQMREAVKMVDQARLERDIMEAKVNESQRTIEDLQKRLSKFTSLFEDSTLDIYSIKDSERIAIEDKLNREIGRLQSEILTHQSKIEKLNSDNSRLKMDNVRVKSQNEYFQEKFRTTVDQNLERSSFLEERISQIERSKKELERLLENTRSTYEGEIEMLKSKLTGQSYLIDSLRGSASSSSRSV